MRRGENITNNIKRKKYIKFNIVTSHCLITFNIKKKKNMYEHISLKKKP